MGAQSTSGHCCELKGQCVQRLHRETYKKQTSGGSGADGGACCEMGTPVLSQGLEHPVPRTGGPWEVDHQVGARAERLLRD